MTTTQKTIWNSDGIDGPALITTPTVAEAAKFRASEPFTGYRAGDILVCSWGYDQTNVDFYRALNDAAIGRMISLEPIEASPYREAAFMADTATVREPITPRSGYGAEIIRRKVQPSGGVKIESYAWARLWDGRALHRSWYA